MSIMSWEYWHEKTYETLNTRGPELTAVDQALKAYHENPDEPKSRAKLRIAVKNYIDYINKKHGGVKNYSRNKDRVIEHLAQEIEDLENPAPEALILRELLREHYSQTLVRVFGGRKVVYKRHTTMKAVVKVTSEYTQALDHCSGIVLLVAGNKEKYNRIIEALGPGWLSEMAKTLVPVIGGIISAGKALKNAHTALDTFLKQKDIKHEHMKFVAKGTATDAAKALLELMQRRRSDAAQRAALYGSSAAIKLGTLLLPGINLAANLAASICEMFGLWVMDAVIVSRTLEEVDAANNLLAKPASELTNSYEIFETYPLLGAYFICFANTNDLLAIVARDAGSLHWQQVTEDIKKRHLAPMKKLALDFLKDSAYQLTGLPIPQEEDEKGFSKLIQSASKLADKVSDAMYDKLNGIIDKTLLAKECGEDWVAEVQPWISSPEAKQAIKRKAAQLQRRAFTTDDLPDRRAARPTDPPKADPPKRRGSTDGIKSVEVPEEAPEPPRRRTGSTSGGKSG